MKDYIRFTIEGLEINKFLGNISAEKIGLTRIYYLNASKIAATCKKSDFERVKKIARNNYILTVIDERGFKTSLIKMKNRKSTVIGTLLFIFLIVYQSLFICRIDITGLKTINEAEVRCVLEDNGIYEGCRRDNYDLEAAEFDIFNKVENIAWMELHREGGVITLDIVESIASKYKNEDNNLINLEKISNDIPVNIVALREGVIEEIIPSAGYPSVFPGDYVYPGDILVTGALINKSDETSITYVHADAKVYARCLYTFTGKEDIYVPDEEGTGKFHPGFYFQFGNIIFNSSNIINSFSKYYINEKVIVDITLPLPIKISVLGINESRMINRKRTTKEILRSAEKDFLKELKKNIGDNARIVNKDLQFSAEENIIEVTGIFETIQEIGGEEPIIYDRTED